MILPLPPARRKARIEIIPLIDVMFFLLATFVMVSLSMIQNKGISVHLPVATSAVAQEQKDCAVITITDRSEIFFNREKVDEKTLKASLVQLKSQSHDPKIFINGDTKASLGNLMAVIDEARQLGITKAAIQTKAVATPKSTLTP